MQGTWDDVPRDRPIAALSIVDWGHGGHERACLAGHTRFYFFNEALAGGGGGILAAKAIGAFRPDGTVIEHRLDFKTGLVSPRVYPAFSFAFSPTVLRDGMTTP